MLRDTFFRVQSYHPYEPLSNKWIAIENGNSFKLYKDTSEVLSYSGSSKGIGKLISITNKEVCIIENGIGQIIAVEESGITHNLGSYLSTSIVCAGGMLLVSSVSGQVLTLKTYKLESTIWTLILIETKTITFTGTLIPCACTLSDTKVILGTNMTDCIIADTNNFTTTLSLQSGNLGTNIFNDSTTIINSNSYYNSSKSSTTYLTNKLYFYHYNNAPLYRMRYQENLRGNPQTYTIVKNSDNSIIYSNAFPMDDLNGIPVLFIDQYGDAVIACHGTFPGPSSSQLHFSYSGGLYDGVWGWNNDYNFIMTNSGAPLYHSLPKIYNKDFMLGNYDKSNCGNSRWDGSGTSAIRTFTNPITSTTTATGFNNLGSMNLWI